LAIPDRLIDLLRATDNESSCRFPPTEVFNEGWMLRLVLDAFERLKIAGHLLSFQPGSVWYSEARLESPFRPRRRPDLLAEGPTNADGVIAKFAMRGDTRAGLALSSDTAQFVVVEAKMFSNLSAGTKNVPAYSQAARNVACMAEAIARADRPLADFVSIGFLVVAPRIELRAGRASNLEACMDPVAVRSAIRQRIQGYEEAGRPEAAALRGWEIEHLLPLIDLVHARGYLRVVSWEDCIEAISSADQEAGAELARFYDRCLSYSPRSRVSV
jgi:hypothetical protein